VSKISKLKPFDHIIWRYPVVFDLNKNLIVKNNLNDKKIIGFQHGAHYLTKKNYIHFDQDFNNCNFWISYNRTEKDYRELWGNKKKICKIVKQITSTKNKIKKKIFKNEILFPIRHINTLYNSTFEDKIVIDKQVQIIKNLEKLKKKYVIKTVYPYSRENCALIDIFKKLKYAKIVSGISLKNYLDLYEHKYIILENYDTPLYDSLEFSNKSKILFTDIDKKFGYSLNKELEKTVPGRVFFFPQVSKFFKKISLLNKLNYKKKFFFNRNNFSISNYSIIDKIIN
tara:strand:+ start:103 stop:954 length:852 start_codon:yes stop_codon:yes gene_type:complete